MLLLLVLPVGLAAGGSRSGERNSRFIAVSNRSLSCAFRRFPYSLRPYPRHSYPFYSLCPHSLSKPAPTPVALLWLNVWVARLVFLGGSR